MLVGFVGLLNVSACSGLRKLEGEGRKSPAHAWSLERAWVRSLPASTNERFRKVNRAQALLVKASTREMLIVANALDGLSAYDPDKGHLLWRSSFQQGIEVSPALFENTLYVGDLSGQFWAVDVETGEKLWSFQSRAEHLSEALVTETRVYFLSGANTLFALDRVTGRQIWSHTRQDSNSASIRAGSRPVLVGDFLLAAFSDGSILSFDATTGSIKWEKALNKGVRFRDLDSDLVVSDSQVFVLGFDDAVYSLKVGTGEVIWKSEQQGGWGRPLLNQGRICFASTQFSVVCLDASNGKSLWKRSLETGVASSPVLLGSDALVYGESQGALQILRLSDGERLASFEPGMGLLSTVLVRRDLKSDFSWLYFISGDANFYALRWKQGRVSDFPFLR